MAHKMICSPLALLNDMDDCESDGGEELLFDAVDDSDPEIHLELSTDEDASGSDEDQSSPPRKKHLEAEDYTPVSSVKLKDGTVWEIVGPESLHGSESSTDVTFRDRAGPTKHAKSRVSSRLHSFLCLFNAEMLQIITDCTVHEAHRRDHTWSLSVSELMAFVAVLFLRATLCPIGAMIESWSEKYAVPAIRETMSRDRYKEIMRYLRFDNKDTRAERVKTDRFAAVSDIWQRFVRNCHVCYEPGQHVTVVEQLFPTKVRCPFLQYVTTKPDKYGIKFWIAADLETKYVCNAIPDLGKDAGRVEGERQSENVVMNLMEPFLDKGRTVTTDNFYTSVSLANRLLNRNTTLLGTIKTIRQEIPPPAKNSTLVYKSGSATLTVYTPKKNKSVCVLSTMHQHVHVADGRKKEPNTITDYNYMKRGVDIMEQKVRAYTVRAGTRRWPVAVFYNMLDLAAMNAHVLYKACTGSSEKRRDFVHGLAEELRQRFLLEKAMNKKQRPSPAPGKTTQCQVQTHCNRNRSRIRCAVCSKYTCRKCRNDGPWVCSKCKK